MATGIIVPGRGLVTQPQYAAPIRKGHPFAKDFTLFINGATPAYNAATGKALPITAGGSGFSQRATPLGTSLYTPDGGWADFAINEDWLGPGTVIAVCRLGFVDTWGALFDKESTGINSQFGVARWSTEDVLCGVVIGTAAKFASPPTITDLTLGFNVLAFTYSGVPADGMSFYYNGNFVSTSGAIDTQQSGTGPLGLGRGRDSSASFDSEVDWIAFGRAKRVMSATEIATLSTPQRIWAMLQAPTRRIWISVAGGTAYTQSLAGSLTAAGALAKQTNKPLAGSSTATGGLVKRTAKAFAGSITGTGSLVKRTAKTFAGSVTGSGALATMILFTASFAGSITPSGALSKMTLKALTGSSTLSGAITKLTSKGLSASITLSGALNKLTTKAFAGSVTATGALLEAYQVVKSLAGSITPTGALATAYIAFVAGVLKMLSLLGVGQ